MTMKQKAISALAATLFACSSSYAFDSLSRDYEFPPNSPLLLTNLFPWQLKMNCIITTSNSNMLSIVMIKNSGSINGHVLNEGENARIEAKNQDHLVIQVDLNAQVEITNQGSSMVLANCE